LHLLPTDVPDINSNVAQTKQSESEPDGNHTANNAEEHGGPDGDGEEEAEQAFYYADNDDGA